MSAKTNAGIDAANDKALKAPKKAKPAAKDIVTVIEEKDTEHIHNAGDVTAAVPVKTYEVLVQETVDKSASKFDLNKKKMEAMKKQFAALTISGPDDKEGLKKMKEAKSTVRGIRTNIEKVRTTEKAFYIEVGKGIDSAANIYKGWVAPIEEDIDTKLDNWEALKKADDERKEEEAKKVLNERIDLLAEHGMVFNGTLYAIGENISMDIVTIKGMKPVDFDMLFAKVKLEKLRLDKIAEEAEQARKNEDARQQKIKEDNEKEEARLKELADKQSADKAKLDEELAQMRRDKLQMREQMAVNAGMEFDPSMIGYKFINKYVNLQITSEAMAAMENADFSSMITDYGAKIKIAKDNAGAEELKERQRQNTTNERTGNLVQMGLTKQGAWYTYKQTNITADAEFAEMTEHLWQKHLNGLITAVNEWEQAVKNDQAKAELTRQRSGECRELGMEEFVGGFIYHLDKINTCTLTTDTIQNANSDMWGAAVADIAIFIEGAKQKAAEEKKRQEDLFDARCNQLIGLGMKKEGVYFYYRQSMVEQSCNVDTRVINAEISEAQWEQLFADAEGKIANIDKSFAAEKSRIEAEKQAALPEIDKANNYLLSIMQIPQPEINNEVLAAIMYQFQQAQIGYVTHAQNQIEALQNS